MSTKTLRKRIALGTVVAVSAGLLSLVSTTAANAATGDTNPATVAVGNAAAGEGFLNVAVNPSTNGSVTAAATDTTTAATSLGLVAWGDLLGGKSAGLLGTVTALNTGIVGFTTLAGGVVTNLITVTNGVITKDGAVGLTISGDLTKAATTTNNNGTNGIGVKAASGAISSVVKLFTDATVTDTATALLGGTNVGVLTLVSQYTITWVAASTAGVVSAAKSGVWYTGAINAAGQTSDSATLVSPGTSSFKADQFADIRVRDAYGNPITGPGLLQATATNGAIINLGQTTTTVPSGGTASTTFVAIGTGAGADDFILDVEAPASAPVSTVVTISYNGTVIGTKSFVFTGNVSKIVLSSAKIGKVSAGTGTAAIAFLDASGNTLTTSDVLTNAAQFAGDATSFGTVVTSVAATLPTSTATGKVTFTCGANAGTTSLDVKWTNTDGTVITSNALPVSCAGASTTYTAAYDKSTYHPGDIATLTVTFKDSKGNLANDVDTQTATTAALVSTAGVTAVAGPSATANVDVSSGGIIKYTYSVGVINGTFTNTVSFANVDTNAKSASLPTGPATATLTIADGSTSLNDVLKGIVSLIASINKQIAALAKLVAPAKKK
jgi:hypothetical protein